MGVELTRTVKAVLAAAAIGAVACGEPGYKARLRALEAELTSRNAVPMLQAWLAERASQGSHAVESPLPPCVRELGGTAAWGADCGGVSVSFVRLEVFTLTVCPPGKRPPMPYHEPSQSQPGYLGPFGADSYISMTER